MLVHHQGKRGEADRRQTGHQHRGSSSFADVPDSSWSLERKVKTGVGRLSFEMRNADAPEPISLVLTEHLWWQPCSEEGEQKFGATSRDVAIAVANKEGMSKSELVEVLCLHFTIKSRKAESLISDTLNEGLVVNRKDKKCVRYYLPDPVQHPHDRIPLEDCCHADAPQGGPYV